MSAPRPRPNGTPDGMQVMAFIAAVLLALLLIGMLLQNFGLG